MKLSSPDFNQGESLPTQLTCEGDNMLPKLKISEVLDSAVSLVLIMSDPDAPGGKFLHWMVWNLDPKTTYIRSQDDLKSAITGKNDFGDFGYGGPCPPEKEKHRYIFELHALDTKLDLDENSSRNQLETQMIEHQIDQDQAQLTEVYQRQV